MRWRKKNGFNCLKHANIWDKGNVFPNSADSCCSKMLNKRRFETGNINCDNQSMVMSDLALPFKMHKLDRSNLIFEYGSVIGQFSIYFCHCCWSYNESWNWTMIISVFFMQNKLSWLITETCHLQCSFIFMLMHNKNTKWGKPWPIICSHLHWQ